MCCIIGMVVTSNHKYCFWFLWDEDFYMITICLLIHSGVSETDGYFCLLTTNYCDSRSSWITSPYFVWIHEPWEWTFIRCHQLLWCTVWTRPLCHIYPSFCGRYPPCMNTASFNYLVYEHIFQMSCAIVLVAMEMCCTTVNVCSFLYSVISW